MQALGGVIVSVHGNEAKIRRRRNSPRNTARGGGQRAEGGPSGQTRGPEETTGDGLDEGFERDRHPHQRNPAQPGTRPPATRG